MVTNFTRTIVPSSGGYFFTTFSFYGVNLLALPNPVNKSPSIVVPQHTFYLLLFPQFTQREESTFSFSLSSCTATLTTADADAAIHIIHHESL